MNVSRIQYSVRSLTEDQGFTAYDFYTSYLRDAEGKISGPATVLAGLGTGITESLLAVTPFESIKTQLYEMFPREREFPPLTVLPTR